MRGFLLILQLLIYLVNTYCQSPWPGESWQKSVNLTGLAAEFKVNLSGAHWNPVKRELWVCDNYPGCFWALKEDGKGSFKIDSIGGQPAKWTYSGDFEGITQAEYNGNSVFIIEESGGKIYEFDVSKGSVSKLIHIWNISSYIPAYANLLGPEGIVFVPDKWLEYNGFADKYGNTYKSKNGMGGIILIAHQNGGHLYAFDLNRTNNSFIFVGEYATGRAESSDLAFDRSTGKLYIWHNLGSNYIEVTDMKSVANSNIRKFVQQIEYYGPKAGNLEGIAITPASSNDNWFFATDDSNQDGYALMWFKNFKPCLPKPFFKSDKARACAGDTVILTDTTIGGCGTEKYIWKFGKGGIPETAEGRGPHKVIYKIAERKDITLIIKGKIKDSLIKEEYITIDSLPSMPIITQNGDTLIAGHESGYQWYLNDSVLDGDTNRILIARKNGNYRVKAINKYGCWVFSDTVGVYIESIKDFNNRILPDVIISYDHTNAVISAKFHHVKIGDIFIELYDITGRCIFKNIHKELNPSINNVLIKIPEMRRGIYFCILSTENYRVSKKLILL